MWHDDWRPILHISLACDVRPGLCGMLIRRVSVWRGSRKSEHLAKRNAPNLRSIVRKECTQHRLDLPRATETTCTYLTPLIKRNTKNRHSWPAANDTNISVHAAGFIQDFTKRADCHERPIRACVTAQHPSESTLMEQELSASSAIDSKTIYTCEF